MVVPACDHFVYHPHHGSTEYDIDPSQNTKTTRHLYLLPSFESLVYGGIDTIEKEVLGLR